MKRGIGGGGLQAVRGPGYDPFSYDFMIVAWSRMDMFFMNDTTVVPIRPGGNTFRQTSPLKATIGHLFHVMYDQITYEVMRDMIAAQSGFMPRLRRYLSMRTS